MASPPLYARLASLGYRTDLALRALGGSEIEDHGDHLLVRTARNPGFWWGNFLLLRRVPAAGTGREWLDRFRAEFPEADHVALGFDGTDGAVTDLAEFASLGLRTEAQTVMTATDVRKPRNWNAEAIYRPLVSDDDWEQSVDLRVRCRYEELDAAGYRTYAAAQARTNRELSVAGHGKWFGAFVDGDLFSQMGLFATEPGLCRFQSVETDPLQRRRGLAGSLVHEVSRYGFGGLGARTLVMVADPEYFAIDLYRSVGFEDTEQQLQAERRPPSPPASVVT